jgi:hypothetical protein
MGRESFAQHMLAAGKLGTLARSLQEKRIHATFRLMKRSVSAMDDSVMDLSFSARFRSIKSPSRAGDLMLLPEKSKDNKKPASPMRRAGSGIS